MTGSTVWIERSNWLFCPQLYPIIGKGCRHLCGAISTKKPSRPPDVWMWMWGTSVWVWPAGSLRKIFWPPSIETTSLLRSTRTREISCTGWTVAPLPAILSQRASSFTIFHLWYCWYGPANPQLKLPSFFWFEALIIAIIILVMVQGRFKAVSSFFKSWQFSV